MRQYQVSKKMPENYDSLITTYRFQHYLFDEDGPFNFDIGENHKYSQNLPHFDLFTNGTPLHLKKFQTGNQTLEATHIG